MFEPIVERLGIVYRLARVGVGLARVKPSSPTTIADLIERQAAARGDHPWVLFEDRRLSYREYNEQANRVAHWGRSQGLAAGDVVALLMQNRPEYPSCWGGMAKLGVTTALLNTSLTGRALAHALEAAGTRRVIAGSECLDALATLDAEESAGLDVWCWRDPAENPRELPEGVRDLDRELEAQPADDPPREWRDGVTAGDPIVFIYTSGTTGLPKAARMSHLRFLSVGAPGEIAGLGADGVMYCSLPLYHSAGGGMSVMSALRTGATLALRRRFSASQFWDDVRRFDATAFQYIGEFCRYLLHQPRSPRDGEHRIAFCIGNGLRPDIWEEFRDRFRIPRIVEFYGATEGNVALLNLDNTVGSVGKRPPAVIPPPRIVRYDVEADDHVRGEDGTLCECEPDEVGEMIAEIPHDPEEARGRFEGYTRKEATDRKILRDVFKPGDSWFRTGDLLKVDRRGYYYFVDRIGDTFRWKGENVSTQEVAEALGAFPGAGMVNVYGVQIPSAEGRAGMAAIVLDDLDHFDGKAFYELVERSLPSYAAPVFLRLQAEPEITVTLKLRKVDLQKQGYDPAASSDPLYVRDDSARAYVALTPERLRAVGTAELRV